MKKKIITGIFCGLLSVVQCVNAAESSQKKDKKGNLYIKAALGESFFMSEKKQSFKVLKSSTVTGVGFGKIFNKNIRADAELRYKQAFVIVNMFTLAGNLYYDFDTKFLNTIPYVKIGGAYNILYSTLEEKIYNNSNNNNSNNNTYNTRGLASGQAGFGLTYLINKDFNANLDYQYSILQSKKFTNFSVFDNNDNNNNNINKKRKVKIRGSEIMLGIIYKF